MKKFLSIMGLCVVLLNGCIWEDWQPCEEKSEVVKVVPENERIGMSEEN